MIVQLEQLYNEVAVILEAAQEPETLFSMQQSKVEAAIKKMSAKIEKDDYTRSVLAANTRVNSDGVSEDLCVRGRNIFTKCTRLADQLGYLSHVVAALQCEDEVALEYSPSFLHRAYLDTIRSGLALNSCVLAVAVGRSATSHLREGRIQAALSALDPEVEMALGLCMLRDSPEQLETAQSKAACDIIAELINGGPNDNVDLSHVLRCLKKVLINKDVQLTADHVLSFTDSDSATYDMVSNASKFLSLSEEKCPEAIARCFIAGPGKEMMTMARKSVAQRAVDRGCLSKWSRQYVLAICIMSLCQCVLRYVAD